VSEPDADDVLAAALIQIAGHAERIADLDGREARRHAETGQLIASLGGRADALSARFDAVTTILGRHASVINAIDGIDSQVSAIARQLAELAPSDEGDEGYQPAAVPRWWHPRVPERADAIDRLQAWVEHVYRPGYGHLSAALPPCWEHHPLCLYTLDWLSELWSVIYVGQPAHRRHPRRPSRMADPSAPGRSRSDGPRSIRMPAYKRPAAQAVESS
jgi:hypothetical protein